MDTNLQALDMSHFPAILQQIQQQLALVTEKVNKHEDLLTRLAALEQENKDLKRFYKTRTCHTTSPGSGRPKGGESSSTPVSPKPLKEAPNFTQIATAAAHKPDPKKKDKKRLAAGRAFATPATKGVQGYQYVYIGRSRKIQRSEVRKHLANASVDLGRVLDICFSASHIIGVLLHVQYVEEFTALLTKAKGELFPAFDPLDPNNIADPKYAGLSDDDRHTLIHQFTEARCLQTLAFLRPLNVSGVGKYFVQKGWICDESLSVAVAQAVERFAKKEPKKADFLFRRKLNSDSQDKAGSDSDMSDVDQ